MALDGIDVLLFLGCKSTIFYKEQCLENRKLFCWPLLVDTQKCRLKVVFLEEMAKDLSSGIATYLKSNLAENKNLSPLIRKPYYSKIFVKTEA